MTLLFKSNYLSFKKRPIPFPDPRCDPNIWASRISLQVASKALAWWRYHEGTVERRNVVTVTVDLFSTSVAASCSSKARTGMVCQNDHFPNRPGLLLRMRNPYPKKNNSESSVDISLQTCQSFFWKIRQSLWCNEQMRRNPLLNHVLFLQTKKKQIDVRTDWTDRFGRSESASYSLRQWPGWQQGLLHVKIFGVKHQHYQQNAKEEAHF